MNPWDPHLVELSPDPERLERVRRRAHRRLEGTERRANPLELGLVGVFSVAMLGWAVFAVLPPS